MLKSLRVSTPSIFPPHSPHPNQETVGGIRQELVAPDDCAETSAIGLREIGQFEYFGAAPMRGKERAAGTGWGSSRPWGV